MRCEAQIARFWLLRSRVSQSLRAHSQTCKHWGREWVRSDPQFAEKQALVLGRPGVRNSAIKLITEIYQETTLFN